MLYAIAKEKCITLELFVEQKIASEIIDGQWPETEQMSEERFDKWMQKKNI